MHSTALFYRPLAHEIAAAHDGGQGLGLDGCGLVVSKALHGVQKLEAHARLREQRERSVRKNL